MIGDVYSSERIDQSGKSQKFFIKEISAKSGDCSSCVFGEISEDPPYYLPHYPSICCKKESFKPACSLNSIFVEITEEEYNLLFREVRENNRRYIATMDPAGNKKDYLVECHWIKKGDSWKLDNIKKVD